MSAHARLAVDMPAPAAEREARFRSLFEAELDFVWRSVRRLGVAPGNVDDATQEVFVVAARKLEEIEVGKERSFLLATAIRVASTARRSQARRGGGDEEAVATLVDQAPTPEGVADRARARAVLDRVLDAMDIDLRAVFVLYELEEMTMAEIAVHLDLPPGTVASRLRRARETFERLIVEMRGTP